MPRKPSANTEPTTLKLPREWLSDAERIAEHETRAFTLGAKITRTEVLRAALGLGLREFKCRMRETKPVKPAKKRASKREPKQISSPSAPRLSGSEGQDRESYTDEQDRLSYVVKEALDADPFWKLNVKENA